MSEPGGPVVVKILDGAIHRKPQQVMEWGVCPLPPSTHFLSPQLITQSHMIHMVIMEHSNTTPILPSAHNQNHPPERGCRPKQASHIPHTCTAPAVQ